MLAPRVWVWLKNVLPGLAGIGLTLGGLAGDRGMAQFPAPSRPPGTSPVGSNAPPCQPPSQGEYLLLVLTQTPESQSKVQSILPTSTQGVVCSYMNDTVTRVSGFTNVEVANSWAQYLTEVTGLPAFVARANSPEPPRATAPAPTANNPTPPGTAKPPTAAATPTPAATGSPRPSTTSFNPAPLGSGYAVLVNYFNRPEIAPQVQQAISRDVGLVSYGQRPYLLAVYTRDVSLANSTLKTLSDRGFWVMMVDSRWVTLLKTPVARQ